MHSQIINSIYKNFENIQLNLIIKNHTLLNIIQDILFLRSIYIYNNQVINLKKNKSDDIFSFIIKNSNIYLVINLKQVINNPKYITSISLVNNIICDQLIEYLCILIKENKLLRNFYLENCCFISEPYNLLKVLKNLNKLVISNIPITPKILSILEINNDLTYLKFSNIGLNLEGVKILCLKFTNLTNIIYLELSCNNIKSNGLRLLSNILFKFNKLRYLDLSDNIIFTDGLYELMLCLNENLTSLNLSKNRIDSNGVNIISALFPTTLKNLEYFNLSYNKFSNKCYDDLFKNFIELKKIKTFDISGNNIKYELNEDIINLNSIIM